MTTPPHLGIDLGTTNTCVAYYNTKLNKVLVIESNVGARTTPSYVSFLDDERYFGQQAKDQEITNPQNTIFDSKRMLGKKFDDERLQEYMKYWPFKVIKGTDGLPKIEVRHMGKEVLFSPEQFPQ
jgi:heat shock protein 1/8